MGLEGETEVSEYGGASVRFGEGAHCEHCEWGGRGGGGVGRGVGREESVTEQ